MAKDSDLDFIKIMQLNDNELFLVYDCQSFLQNISIYSVNNLSTPICEPLYVSEKYCVDSLNKIYNSIDALNIPEIYINFNKQKIKLNSSSIH